MFRFTAAIAQQSLLVAENLRAQPTTGVPSRTPSTLTTTPFGHNIFVAITPLDKSRQQGALQQQVDFEVDTNDHDGHIVSLDPNEPFGVSCRMYNYVRDVNVIRSVMTVVDPSNDSGVTVSLDVVDDTVKARIEVYVKWEFAGPKPGAGHQRNGAMVALQTHLQKMQAPQEWKSTALFRYGRNHSRWIPSEDAIYRVLLKERVSTDYILDAQAQVIGENVTPTKSGSRPSTGGRREVSPRKKDGTPNYSHSKQMKQLDAVATLSRTYFPILPYAKRTAEEQANGSSARRDLPPPPPADRPHREDNAGGSSLLQCAPKSSRVGSATKTRLGSARSERSIGSQGSAGVVSTEPSRVSQQADEATSSTVTSGKQPSDAKPRPLSGRLYQPQISDPKLEAAAWKRRLLLLEEEQRNMSSYLEKAKILDELFV